MKNEKTDNSNEQINKKDLANEQPSAPVDIEDDPAAEALDFMAAKILEAFETFDWDKWFRRHSDPTTENLEKFFRILAPLSRARLNRRIYDARIEAAARKTALDLKNFLGGL
jgi:hypothetical protein